MNVPKPLLSFLFGVAITLTITTHFQTKTLERSHAVIDQAAAVNKSLIEDLETVAKDNTRIQREMVKLRTDLAVQEWFETHPTIKYLVRRNGPRWVVEQWTTHPRWGYVVCGIFGTKLAAELYANQLTELLYATK